MDNTLNSSYGADLKLFYVEDYQSLTSLSSVGIASQNTYASLETTTFGYSRTGNIITGYTYDLTYERGKANLRFRRAPYRHRSIGTVRKFPHHSFKS